MAHDVFISYASQDKMIADAVCATLEMRRIRCWIAPRDILPSEDYGEAIIDAIRGSRLVVLVFSGSSNASEHVKDEVERAASEGKAILPFRVEDVPPKGSLALHLSRRHWLDALTPPLERHLDHLAQTVRDLLGKLAGPAEEIPPKPGAPAPPAGDKATTRGRYVFLAVCCLLLMLVTWYEMLGPLLSRHLVDPHVDKLIRGHRWITYDPRHFDPTVGAEPDPSLVDKELDWVRAAGFDGIITFSSRYPFSEIPGIAKRKGLLVIAGVWDPTDEGEVGAAIAKRGDVDAYCVGHNNLGRLYAYGELVRAVRRIRFRTRRPVTTTEKLGLYLSDPRILQLGDWIFPDAHVSVTGPADGMALADAVRDGRQTISMAKSIASHPERKGRPILLKMVTYPMRGVTGASLEEQAAFFTSILDSRRDTTPDMPLDVGISVHSAFDTGWKKAWPFYEWDRYTGLLDENGRPRPAAGIIVEKTP